ncbi:MAG: putative MarR family transcriptional regulator [Pseudonocardiales bacterium]|nr:putative MarR family transcriptional regulator [Jatrophihabitantaceae bacterium]MCW2603969.1 putative MarR family transcriptional regulator [Pseudonocardiales bacterium]
MAQAQIDSLERELLLLGRHSALVAADAVAPRLERSAYLLLTRLELSGELTLKELADALRLDVSTVNRQCASLLRQGLAERIPSRDDTIARRYRPTAHGLALLHADRDDRLAGVASIVEGWSAKETAQLVDSLRRFNESIERQQCLEWPR